MPWLFYQGNSSLILNDTQRVKLIPSFDPNDPLHVNKLEFYVAKYDIQGNYYGIERLANQLNLCSDRYEDGQNFQRFGTTIRQECRINLANFAGNNYTMYFYELFLFDNMARVFIDIPVMISNIPNEKAQWRMNNSTSPSDWLLTRRFFLVDNLVGLNTAGSYLAGGTPIAYRYPHLLKLKVQLQNTDDPRIMLPYLEIFYKTKTRLLLNILPDSLLFFESEYLMDERNYRNAMAVIFALLNVVAFVHVIIKMISWYRLNPPTLSPVRVLT